MLIKDIKKKANLSTDEFEEFDSPKERVPMIEEVFKLVLGREPSSRELSFYKYGIQSREEIIEKLLSEDEHTELLEKIKEFPELENRAKKAERQVDILKQSIEDRSEEFQNLKNLLDEKSREIAILRREVADPYNFKHSEALKYIETLTENSRSIQEDTSNNYSTLDANPGYIKKETFLDKIYNFLKSFN
jgi:predicted RNase H-like nuclease (RuvC/YqgF family)